MQVVYMCREGPPFAIWMLLYTMHGFIFAVKVNLGIFPNIVFVFNTELNTFS